MRFQAVVELLSHSLSLGWDLIPNCQSIPGFTCRFTCRFTGHYQFLSHLVTDLRQFCEVVKHGEFQGFLATTFMQLIVQLSSTLRTSYHFVLFIAYKSINAYNILLFCVVLCNGTTTRHHLNNVSHLCFLVPGRLPLRDRILLQRASGLTGLTMPWGSWLAPAKLPKTTMLTILVGAGCYLVCRVDVLAVVVVDHHHHHNHVQVLCHCQSWSLLLITMMVMPSKRWGGLISRLSQSALWLHSF